MQYNQMKEFDPIQRQLNEQGGNLVLKLLQGQALPGYLNTLPGGIDEATTQSIANRSIQDIQPYFAQSGLLDSGVNASVSGRIAGDVRQQSAAFNIQNLQQLLNIAVGGQAQVQQPILSTGQMLGQRLAGLRTGTSSSSGATYGMNPFLKSFQQSAGNTMGQGSFGNFKAF
jgi:hypothetical protein